MLKQRVITAVVLLLILLPALFYPSPQPFCALALVLVAAGGWEWARLNGAQGSAALLWGAAVVGLCAVAWWAGALARPLTPLWLLSACVWVLGGAWLLGTGPAGWSRLPKALRLACGPLVLAVAWLAIAQAKVLGTNFLLSVLLLVWVADIFAYFAGRALGGRFFKQKLAPSISPGKSWEGVWGGMAGVLLMAFIWQAMDARLQATVPSLYTHLFASGWWVMVLAAVFMAAMSVVGDLVESLMKRSAGAKDSSNLLPGHGGVLDRLDALLPTLPLAMMLLQVA